MRRFALGAAPAAADETYVVDVKRGDGWFNGALFRVDPASGNRSLISDFGNAAQGPLGAEPFGLALEAGGTVLVSDEGAGTGGSTVALFRVDPASGNRSLVSDFGNAAQGPQGVEPRGLILVEAGGTVLVIDESRGDGWLRGAVPGGPGERRRAAWSRTSVTPPRGRWASAPVGLALEAGGTVLAIDVDAGTGGHRGAVPGGPGERRRAAWSRTSVMPPRGRWGLDPSGLALEAGGTALVID